MPDKLKVNFDRLSTGEIFLFAVLVLALVGTGFYIWRLETRADTLSQQKLQAKQRNAALQDSLRKMGEYEDTTGLSRTLYGKLDLPTYKPDTLGQAEQIDGEVKGKTDATIDPKPGRGTGNVEAKRRTPDSLHFELDEKLGRYTITGTASVGVKSAAMDYDLRVNGGPIQLSFYQTVRNGQNQSVIDAPSTVELVSMQGTSRPRAETKAEFDKWRVRLPVAVFRPDIGAGIAVGGTVARRVDLPLGAVGYGEVGIVASPSYPNTQVAPVAQVGIEWNF